MDYDSVSLAEDEIADGRYKQYLGGGAAGWERRGEFQLRFLEKRGLCTGSRLLDVGCGPLRAGVHLIGFLDEGNYGGFDANESFVAAAHHVVRARGLEAKRPWLACIQDFALPPDLAPFDLAIAFSVLNHCTPAQRAAFFRNLPAAMRPGARVFVSHARWFEEDACRGTAFERVASLDDVGLDVTDFGWTRRTRMFPILELAVV